MIQLVLPSTVLIDPTDVSHPDAQALATRALIGRAVGLTMSKDTLDSDTAFAFLVQQSQDSNTKLRDICAAMVTDADGLAQAD